MSSSSWIRLCGVPSALLVLFLTRWPLIPRYLVNFDLANFAFALEDFNPAEHKPQPPGYALYVGLTRLIRLYSDDVATVFVIAGFVGCLVASVALARLAELSFGIRAAMGSVVLLLFHPTLWTAGILNPVRVFLAAGSAVIGLLAWPVWRGSANRWRTVALWAALGIVSGFRPGLLLLMLPLCLAAMLRRRSSASDWALSALALLVGVASWLLVSAHESGGLYAYVRVLGEYLDEQSENTSVLFGASLVPALKMAGRATIWTAAPAAAWLWAVPLLSRATVADGWRKAGLFVVLWSGPSFLFSTLVHSAEPGHILPMVAPLCLTGAFVIGQLQSMRSTAGALVAAAAINIALFYGPPLRVLRPSSVDAIRLAEHETGKALTVVSELQRRGPLTIIASPAASVAWRVLSYYYRQTTLVVLHSDPASAASSGYWLVRNGQLIGEGRQLVRLPASGRLVWFLSAQSPLPQIQGVISDSKRADAVIATDLSDDTRLKLGNYKFVTPGASAEVSAFRRLHAGR